MSTSARLSDGSSRALSAAKPSPSSNHHALADALEVLPQTQHLAAVKFEETQAIVLAHGRQGEPGSIFKMMLPLYLVGQRVDCQQRIEIDTGQRLKVDTPS